MWLSGLFSGLFFGVANKGHRGDIPSTEADAVIIIEDNVAIPSLNDVGR